jgi:hypothetical protein
MTLPSERTRAVVNAGEFLLRLSNPYVPAGIKKIPGPVRDEARRLLKHYPSVVDMMYVNHSFDREEAKAILDKAERAPE